MKLFNIFNIASAAVGFVLGGVGALAFGLPMAAVPVAAFSAAVGAGLASKVSGVTLGALFDGKGPSAGFAGLAGLAAAHLTVVPVAAVVTSRFALDMAGFIPS